METCTSCSGPTKGYACNSCGTAMDMQDMSHSCGTDHVMPMCGGCSKAQASCTCGA